VARGREARTGGGGQVRQRDGEDGTRGAVGPVADLERAAEQRHHVAAEVEAEPGPPLAAGGRLVELDEALEDALALGRRDAGPVVADGEQGAIRAAPTGDLDGVPPART
jgi:hypothetical protein